MKQLVINHVVNIVSNMDSAKKEEVEFIPVLKSEEEKDPLHQVGGRKFLLTVLGIVIFGIFTATKQMEVETYMYLFSALTAGYFGINFTQKKMLN